jgi:hypothetical protein
MPEGPVLILKRGRGPDRTPDDYDVLHQGEVVGRIYKERRSWFWGMAYGHHRDRHPSHGAEPTREAAMAAFRKSWLRE